MLARLIILSKLEEYSSKDHMVVVDASLSHLFNENRIRFELADINTAWLMYKLYEGNLDALCDLLQSLDFHFCFMCYTHQGVYIRKNNFESDY